MLPLFYSFDEARGQTRETNDTRTLEIVMWKSVSLSSLYFSIHIFFHPSLLLKKKTYTFPKKKNSHQSMNTLFLHKKIPWVIFYAHQLKWNAVFARHLQTLKIQNTDSDVALKKTGNAWLITDGDDDEPVTIYNSWINRNERKKECAIIKHLLLLERGTSLLVTGFKKKKTSAFVNK